MGFGGVGDASTAGQGEILGRIWPQSPGNGVHSRVRRQDDDDDSGSNNSGVGPLSFQPGNTGLELYKVIRTRT